MRTSYRQPPTRVVRKQEPYRSCQRKTGSYVDERGARAEARQATLRYGKYVQPYRCPFCARWHVGTATRYQRFVTQGHRKRPDPVLLDVLGDRTYWCGHIESTGAECDRVSVITRRAAAVARRHAQASG